jgi:amino acid adenylation domain-containing protein
MLRNGEDAVADIPAERFRMGFSQSTESVLLSESGRFRGGFLDQIDRFDPAFFGISPREAVVMDPQQRLMLELAWEALEDAGILPARPHDARTGVFIGASADDYAKLQHSLGIMTRHTATGSQRGLISNRISYSLGLTGPSITVDSAQSSSLVAVHLAVESLRSGESAVAIAGGVHLNLLPEGFAIAELFGALSPDGRSSAFDAEANGYVRGEGGGAVVLKPLQHAVADGDLIYAVIRGSAVNNDGSGGETLTAPYGYGQENVLRLAYERAGIDPRDVQYVEAHGTGTRRGDPVEAAALGTVIGSSRRSGSPLIVGSAKTNIGHLEGAAGIAGLIKTVLCVKNREIPPSLNFKTPHPDIPLEKMNLRVQQSTAPWPRRDVPLVAGVSSFGMGGTNCHVVLSEWVPPADRSGSAPAFSLPPARTPKSVCAWPVSGRSEAALREQANRLLAHVVAHPEQDVSDLAGSLATTRTAFEYRAVVVGDGLEELLAGLTALAESRNVACGLVQGLAGKPRTAFLCSGQGSQRLGMGRELYATFPVYAQAFDAVCARIDHHLRGSVSSEVKSVVFSADSSPEAQLLDQTVYTQSALFAVEVALFRLLEHWGARPDYVMGHSIGELAAAHIADVLSLDDACAMVAARAGLIQGLPTGGAMVAVRATESEVLPSIAGREGQVSLAAVNGPAAVVLSGDKTAVDEIAADWAERGRTPTPLRVSHAFHSPRMDGMLATFRERVAGLPFRPPRIPLISTVTGKPVTAEELASPDYWARQVRGTVRFFDAMRWLEDSGGVSIFAELGPRGVLVGMGRDCVSARDAAFLPALRSGDGEPRALLTMLAGLHVRGARVDWDVPAADAGTRRLRLPTYAFQRDRYWIELPADGTARKAEGPTGDGSARTQQADPLDDHAPADKPLPRRLAQMSVAEARRELLTVVCVETAGVLGHDNAATVPTTRAFRDLGLDSYGSVELHNRLHAVVGRPLPDTLLFDHPTPAAVAELLCAELFGDTPVSRDVSTTTVGADEPIAIVAMACRFPGGVDSPEELWRMVADERDLVGPFPDDRGWDTATLYDPEPGRAGTCYTQSGGFLVDAAAFDAGFFGISPREALAMDPQQRLLLETAWEAIERAGIDPATLRGSQTGVFTGVIHNDYGPRLHEQPDDAAGHALTGTLASVASGRISYTLGLHGPAVTLDTACSSSLVALHYAVRALRTGECSLALAGGATVMSTPGMFLEFSRQRGLSPDGRCKAFAAAADGTGWAEGAGILLLERLTDAQEHGHPVLAVIRGTATNQDGASNGLSAPNGPAQQQVIRQALADAHLTPADVDLLEGHGTGTPLGDPIEAQALLATYGQDRPANRPAWLGSLKSNIGHTLAAAGVAGVIKSVMALHHRLLPRTLHVDTPTPHVDWTSGAIRLLTQPQPWPDTQDRPRRAAISSFGISGTNAHLILEQAPPRAATPQPPTQPQTLPWILSARTDKALRDQARRLASWVGVQPEAGPVDIGRSLVSARSTFERRAVVIAEDRAEFVRALGGLADGEALPGVVRGTVGEVDKTVFVFPGQGTQWAHMGQELLDASPVFAEHMRACDEALRRYADWSVLEVLAGTPGAPDLERVDVVQPALFAVMVSLAALWRSYGVEPDAVVGHSQGEIAAAFVVGALSLDDAARVVTLRSQVLRTLAGRGGMMSVSLPADQVRDRLAAWDERLCIAAANSPTVTVVSGDPTALGELHEALSAEGVHARRISVDYASHSSQVTEIHRRLVDALAPISPRSSNVPFYSTLTGGLLDTAELGAEYWYRNLRCRVRFDQATRSLLDDGYTVFVESSPHPVLTAAIEETMNDAGSGGLVVGSLHRNDGGWRRWLTSLAQAHVGGVSVRWAELFAGCAARRIDLPTYAFQHQRYWAESTAAATGTAPPGTNAPESRFWEAVERQDAQGLAALLPGSDGDGAAWNALLPGLSSWRRRQRDKAVVDGWRYHTVWRSVALTPAPAAGLWLAVVPTGCAADAVIESCLHRPDGQAAQVVVIEVSAGEADRDVLAERVRSALDVPSLDGAPVRGVLSLLALDQPGQPEPAERANRGEATGDGPVTLAAGLASTVALLQALGDADVPGKLWCVTRGAVSVGPSDRLRDPLQAQLWGLGRCAALEHPDRWGGLVDLPDTAWERTAALLWGVIAGSGAEDQVAVRASGVYARRLVRAPASGPDRRRWTPRGTVLITGGTGALGARLARWLARGGAEHLVLVSRSGPLAPGAADLVAELTELGAQVTVAACDVKDRPALDGVIQQALADGSAVRAVFHAAGTSQYAPLMRTNSAELADVVSGKVAGAVHLADLLESEHLDAFVLFSSGAGTWGGAVQGAYAAANAFLDAMAEWRRARGLQATAVAWGPWAEGGMAEPVADRLRRLGLPGMAPELTIAALQQALDRDETTVTVADIEWERFVPAFSSARPSPLLAEIPEARDAGLTPDGADSGPPSDKPLLGQQLQGLSDAERCRRLQEVVYTQAAAALGHAEPGAVEEGRAFRDLGFDSVTAIELRNRLNAATGLRLPSTVVFDHPTPLALARHLDAAMPGGRPDASAAPVPATVAAMPAGGPVSKDDDPIAVVSMACRYPGNVGSPEDLWRLVADGVDAISDPPTNRGWDLANLFDSDPGQPGTSYVREGGFLYDADQFDPAFFGISPREALAMDPQQRLLLEASWEVFERAGIDPSSLRGAAAGVFVGMSGQTYASLGDPVGEDTEGYVLTGTHGGVASGRLAYTYGFEGPAITIDTACSSSLVALHLACQALRQRECSLALSAGVAVMSSPGLFIEFSRQRGLSPDGRCRSFAAGANGTGWSEGVGMLLLERLSDARRHGHQVLALVRGSAMNQDGASNGLAAPNGLSQQQVVRQSLANARLSASDVDVVEAHGTGTTLGDPIEAQALLATYGQDHSDDKPLWLGSLKSNIGHSAAAAGVGGVIKMVMAMRHGTLPKTLHVDEPSPHIDWSAGAVRLLTESLPWPDDVARPRRAGVSGFGVGGTNVHVILEQEPTARDTQELATQDDGHAAAASTSRTGCARPSAVPWVLSGRTPGALRDQAARLASHVAGDETLDPVDVGHSLVSTRALFKERAVVIAEDRQGFLDGLAALAGGDSAPNVVRGTAGPTGKTVFVFPGQGSQWPGMAAGLLDHSAVFAERMSQCAQALAPWVDWSLLDVLRRTEGAPSLDRVDVVQPALWAVMVSLAALWRSYGVEPDAVVGHSQGEIAAACVAGALSLDDAAKVAALRARALIALSGRGGMMAVAAPADDVARRLAALDGQVSIAAVNSPQSTIVSGDLETLGRLATAYRAEDVTVREISVDYASHSPHVETVHEDLVTSLGTLAPRDADVPLLSTVTGEWIDPPYLDADYWYTNLRRTVHFAGATAALAEQGFTTFVEVSPHPVVTVSLQETLDTLPDAGHTHLITGTLVRDDDSPHRLLTSLAGRFVGGAGVEWKPVFEGAGAKTVPLPTYPFQRRRYWLSPATRNAGMVPDPSGTVDDTVDQAIGEADPQSAARPWRARIRDADPGARPAVTREYLTRTIAEVIGADATDLDVQEPFQSIGLDSLMTLEIRNALAGDLGISLPLVTFREARTISMLGKLILPMIGTPGESVGADSAAPTENGDSPRVVPDPSARYEPFPLTDLQQAYFVGRSNAFALGNVSTHFCYEIDVEAVDLPRLTDALRRVIERHDMLRAVVTPDGYQQVLEEVPPYEIRTVDLTRYEEPERARVLKAIREEMWAEVIDTTTWPLFDIRATRIDQRTTRLHVGIDALVMDAWSTSLVFREWATVYRGDAHLLPEAAVTFRDCVTAMCGIEGSPLYRRSLEYWRGRIPTLPLAPELPLAKDPSSLDRPAFTRRSSRLAPENWTRFKAYAGAAGVTPSVALCTAYAQVLAAWSKSERFTLDLLIANRQSLSVDLGNVVGNLTTTVLLEVDSSATDGFTTRANRLQAQMWSDIDHSQVSGIRVLREMNRARGGPANVTMPVVFASTVNFAAREDAATTNGIVRHLTTLGESGREVWSALRTPQVWLDHQVVEDEDALLLNWDSVDEIFPDGLIASMFAAYVDVLRELSQDESSWQRPAPLLTPPAELDTRRAVNATASRVPDELLHEGFVIHAAATPQRTAVIAPERTLTYGALDRLSNRLDHWLRAQEAGPGTLVAIVMEKGWEQVAAALAITKSGAAYVPIDADVPPERLRLLLQSARTRLVLTQSRVGTRCQWPDGTMVLSVDGPQVGALPDQPLASPGTAPDDLAYVIYTSGSTGVPKGVMIEHSGAVNTIHDINERFAVTANDRALALSALNFDLSVYDVFGMLSAGGAIVIPEPQAHREPERWLTLVAEHSVTVWNTVPALMEMFTDHALANGRENSLPLRLVMMSGDWIPVTLPDRIRALCPDAEIWSLGGATEASIWSILYPIRNVDPAWLSIPYGTPMRNQQCHVLNDAMRPCPVWVPGQLYISGAGLARGYLGDEAKTRSSFVRHPVTGERLYRTGDLGRYLPDGNIEFLGREDFQVKVRGYRIELGEIEAALLRCPGVHAAEVTAIGEPQAAKRLVGYVVTDHDACDTETDLEKVLRHQLPEYLIPQHLVVLDELPLSANGKIDRAALPAPDARTGAGDAGVAPRDDLERRLADIWEELFDARPISVSASFFDLGGDSMLAVRLMARIQRELGRSLPVSTLFSRPSIELLAGTLREAGAALASRREALVPIRTQGTQPPLFLVHPVGGDVLCYAELVSQLDKAQPCYGLQVPDTPLATVAELAAYYIQAMRTAAPSGPYRLGGWSMGGVIALEMAGQLARAGEPVDLVAAVDLLEPPGPAHVRTVDNASLVCWIARDLAGLAGVAWDPNADDFRQAGREPLEILYDEVRRASVLPPDIGIDTLGRIVERFSRNARALLAHQPRQYEGRVEIFKACDGGASEETTQAWLALCPGETVATEVPGDHYTVMRRPHLDRLAERLNAVLAQMGDTDTQTKDGDQR